MFNSVEMRRRQIDTLKIFNDNVFAIEEDKKYGIKFKSGSNEVTLVIELCPEFPYKKPKLSLDPKLNHSWIENDEITQFPGLINFTINSDLGRVAQAIIREYEKNPPELADKPSVPVMVASSSSFAELNNLDNYQLMALLSDEQYLDDFVEELAPIKAQNAELDSLIEQNEQLARENLEKNSRLCDLKASVSSLTSDFVNLGDMYSETNRKYKEKTAEYSPQNIRQLLEIGVSNAESECEATVEAFLEGHQNLSQFLDDFMKVKKLIATRKFKEERLNFQLNQLTL